ncbi:MAG: hypothetical protein IJ573_04395 [Clostridia bacterium]|nr:hypothetical protein [Clostridia bacterium]
MCAGGGAADLETLLFFEKHPSALPLYEALEAMLRETFPGVHKRVQKTQITFYDRHVFACASLQRVKRKAELPDPYLVLTLGLPAPLSSERAAVQCEPYPGRWTVHIVIGSAAEIDGELIAWVRQAYAFALAK